MERKVNRVTGNTLTVNLLGSVRVALGDVLLSPFATRKSALLFAYLATRRARPLDRAQVAAALWPDTPDARARRNLNTELWRLRQTLGPAAVAVRADSATVQFDPPFSFFIDAETIRDLDEDTPPDLLARAVEHYQGDFLSGFYDDWVLEEQERLRDNYLRALERLLDCHRRAGAIASAIACAHRILAHDPLREEIHRQLMRLHLDEGDRVSAARQYRRCVEALSRELGVGPMPETEALYHQLLGGEHRIETGAGARSLSESAFVGRDGEWARLQEAWGEARARLRVVTVAGEAGLGKTRLIEEWAAAIEDGALVLKSRCYEAGERSAYQPIVELLRSALKHPLASRLESLPRVWLAEIARLSPEIYELWPDVPENPELSAAQSRERLFTALTGALAALTTPETPLLLFIDDLHWADGSTLDLLTHLIRALADSPLLLLVTYRPEALALSIEQQLNDWLLQLAETQRLAINLPPLSRQQTAELLWRMGGTAQPPANFADRIYFETEGNPLFVIETLRSLFDSGYLRADADGAWAIPIYKLADDISQLPIPAGMRAALETRLDRLNQDQRDFLTLAAVVGREFDYDLLLLASGQDETRLLDSLAGPFQSGLIRELPGAARFEFNHDKIREIIYQRLEESHRRHLHRRVARALDETNATVTDSRVEALAHHYALSDDRVNAIKYLLLAGARAESLHAYRTAEAHYTHALDVGHLLAAEQRLDLLMKRYHCRWVLGDHDTIASLLAQAVALAQGLADNRRLAELWLAQGVNLVSKGAWVEAKTLLDNALAAALDLDDPLLEARARSGLANICMHTRQIDAAMAHFNRMLQLAEVSRNFRLKGQALLGLVSTGHPAEQASAYLQVLSEALERGTLDLVIDIASDVVLSLWMAGRLGDSLAQGERLLSLARAQGISSLERSLLRALSGVRCEIGEYETARALAQESLRSCRAAGYRYGEMRALACSALADAGLGFADDAILGLQKAIAMSQGMGAWQEAATFQNQATKVLLSKTGNPPLERAREIAEASLLTARAHNFQRAEMLALAYLSQISLRQGDTDAAHQLSTQAVRLLEAAGHANGYEPLIWFAHACALRALGDPEADGYLARARALLATRACSLPDRALRRKFLHGVPLHRAICLK